MSPDQPRPGPATRRFIKWSLRHGRTLWLLAVLMAIPAAGRTVQLYRNLRSELEELLPRDAPSVVAIGELRQRMAGLQYLGVVVDTGTPARPDRLARADRLVDDLAARIRGYPGDLVSAVRTGWQAEHAFVERNAAALLDLEDLKLIRGRIEDRVHWEYATQTGTLIDDSEPPPRIDFTDIQQKYERRLAGPELAGDRFSSPKLGLALLLIEVGGFSTSASKADALIARVRADLAALGGAEHYAPGLRIGFTGDVAISSEEMSALVQDLTVSSLLVVVVVVIALMVFYRWRRSVPALFLPLAIAAVGAFALASLPPFNITELNSNTAFLGSIIVGNGINFGIIQLARYVEARRAGHAVEDALAIALWGTRMGTLSAAVAAGVAYASLVAMQFRGFRQFGVIGGLGMVLSWVATVVLAPPLIAWLDRGKLHPDPRPLSARARRPMAVLARAVTSYPRVFTAAAALLTIGAAVEIRHFGRGQLEYDFSRLRRRDTWSVGEGFWGAKMDTLLGRYLTPTVLLTDSAGEARVIAAQIRQAALRPPLDSMVASVRTIDDVLPPDLPDKRAEVEAIRRKLTPRLRSHIGQDDQRKLDRLIGTAPLAPISQSEIPDALTTGLRERDGALGRAVLVFPNPTNALWRGATIAAFVTALRDIAQLPTSTGGRAARVAGGPPLTADIIQSMERDGPLASLLAFAGVMATVVVIFRRSSATPFVIGSLIVGVGWLLAAAMVLGIKINFVNFIAFPITFGIGVDYAVNVMARYLREGERDVASAIRGTGGAVGLCSLTTIVGYSSLLVAQNVGLFLFGLLAVLGEVACLTTAVVVMPAVLQLLRPTVPRGQPAFDWDQGTVAAAPASATGSGSGPLVPPASSSGTRQH
ncbi:MAG TPA: MMPL family transporter [Polyangia bacterium]|nr:MMPL family transporter [Polyangia bacterium]